MKPPMPLLKPGHHPTDGRVIIIDLTEVSQLAQAHISSNSCGVPILGNGQADKNLAMLIHGSPSCAEKRLAPYKQPSLMRRKDRATPSGTDMRAYILDQHNAATSFPTANLLMPLAGRTPHRRLPGLFITPTGGFQPLLALRSLCAWPNCAASPIHCNGQRVNGWKLSVLGGQTIDKRPFPAVDRFTTALATPDGRAAKWAMPSFMDNALMQAEPI
jgi:hypothetical protein